MTGAKDFAQIWKTQVVLTNAVKFALMPALVLVSMSTHGVGQPSTNATIQSLQVHLKMYPQDFKAYDALGAIYIQKGRETADASYYELAKEALNKSLDLNPVSEVSEAARRAVGQSGDLNTVSER